MQEPMQPWGNFVQSKSSIRQANRIFVLLVSYRLWSGLLHLMTAGKACFFCSKLTTGARRPGVPKAESTQHTSMKLRGPFQQQGFKQLGDSSKAASKKLSRQQASSSNRETTIDEDDENENPLTNFCVP